MSQTTYEVLDEAMRDFIKQNKISKESDKKENILDAAKRIVDGDREKTYGDPGKNITLIADLWASYLDTEISAEDVCHMMVLLKVARLRSNSFHTDSDIDACGYLYLKNKIRESREEEL